MISERAKQSGATQMVLSRLQTLKPTRPVREMVILAAIQKDPDVSQRQLASQASISAPMVNAYLGEMVEQGLIHVTGETNRTTRYEISRSGVERLRQLVDQAAKEVVQFYGNLKGYFRSQLELLVPEGMHRIVIFGAAETGELVYAVAPTAGLTIVGVVDNDVDKHGKPFGNALIESPDCLAARECDAVVITSYGHGDEIETQCREMSLPGVEIVRL
jgi:DNA-binding MarR family transcriptional regulator